MKGFAIFLMVLCLAAMAGTGYLYLTSNIVVEDIVCTAYAAEDQSAAFQALKNQVGGKAFTGTPFNVSDIGAAENYQFYEYALRIRNDSFLKAEVIEIQITPMNGDVLQISDLKAHDLSPRSSGTFTATILTAKEMHNVREMTVTYYLWGLPFSTRVAYSSYTDLR